MLGPPGTRSANKISLIQSRTGRRGVGRGPGVRPTINADVRGHDKASGSYLIADLLLCGGLTVLDNLSTSGVRLAL